MGGYYDGDAIMENINGPGWIQSSVEELAGNIVLADPSDPAQLTDLHTRMEKIEQWAAQECLHVLAEAVKATAGLIEKIILEEVPDPPAAMDVAGRAVSTLQAILLEGRTLDEVNFPNELNIKSSPPSAGNPRQAKTEEKIAPSVPTTDALPDGSGTETASQQSGIEGDPTLLAEFINESNEHLDGVDVHLLTLETDPQNEESLNSVFRAFHTIKGVAGLLGLDQIGTLAHEAENLLDRMRKHELT